MIIERAQLKRFFPKVVKDENKQEIETILMVFEAFIDNAIQSSEMYKAFLSSPANSMVLSVADEGEMTISNVSIDNYKVTNFKLDGETVDAFKLVATTQIQNIESLDKLFKYFNRTITLAIK